MPRIPRKALTLSIAAMALIVFTIAEALHVAGVEAGVRARPDADSLVMYDGTQMSKSHFLLEYAIPEQAPWFERPFWWLNENGRWALVYVLGGLLGGIGALWLEAAGVLKPREGGDWAASLAASAFAGFLFWCLLLLPQPLLGRAIPGVSLSSERLSKSLIVFPMLAGLFLSVFFERMKAFLGKNLPAKD